MRGIDRQVARLGVAETRLEISQGHDLTQIEIHHLFVGLGTNNSGHTTTTK